MLSPILPQISELQSRKAQACNELFEAGQVATLFGINRIETEALTLAYFGGPFVQGSTLTEIAAGTETLVADTTNYIEASLQGTVSSNSSAFTTGKIPLYTVLTSTEGILAITDHRVMLLKRVIPVNLTPVGNVGSGEDDLMTYPLPANSLSAGRGLRIKAWGTTANNGNSKQVKLFFGSLAILTTALTVSQAGVWEIEAEVYSTGTDAQRYIARLLQGGATTLIDAEQGTHTQDDGATITIKCTGEATSNNDIQQNGFVIESLN